MKVEILHVRDSDDGCFLSAWINGEEMTEFTIEDVDPGRGYTREEWGESTQRVNSKER